MTRTTTAALPKLFGVSPTSTRVLQLTTGEQLEDPQDRIDGIMTDAGLIPWDLVAGTWCLHQPTQRWMFISV